MPITQITLENFKGVGDAVTVPLRPITLLFGANSAGKSTLLQALLYLRELLESQNADADVLPASGTTINLGGFRQFVHRHDLSRKVRIGVTVTVDDDDGLPLYQVTSEEDEPLDPVFSEDPLPDVKTVGVIVGIRWHNGTSRSYVTEYEVAVNGRTVGKIEAEPPPLFATMNVDEHHPIFRGLWPVNADGERTSPERHDSSGQEIVGPLGYFAGVILEVGSRVVPQFGKPLETLGTLGSDDSVFMSRSDALRLFSHIFVGVGETVLHELKRIRYIGPIREIPPREFAPQRTPDLARWADGSGAWDWLRLNPDYLSIGRTKELAALGLGIRIEKQHTLNDKAWALMERLIELGRSNDHGTSDSIAKLLPKDIGQIEGPSRVRIVAEETGVEVAPCDIGVGVAQVLPVVIGSMAPGYSVLAVEQPELHVHPAVQTRLADVLARQVVGTQDRLLLLETHSEHLMLRLLRRIREQQEGELEPGAPEIKPEHLSVLYLSNEGGAMQITELPVTPDGDFSRPWPKGFFEERSAELF